MTQFRSLVALSAPLLFIFSFYFTVVSSLFIINSVVWLPNFCVAFYNLIKNNYFGLMGNNFFVCAL